MTKPCTSSFSDESEFPPDAEFPDEELSGGHLLAEALVEVTEHTEEVHIAVAHRALGTTGRAVQWHDSLANLAYEGVRAGIELGGSLADRALAATSGSHNPR